MNPVILLMILICVAGIIFLSSDFLSQKDKRKRYLASLIKLLKADVTPIEGMPGSVRLSFVYRQESFTYEDVEDKIADRTLYRGYLRLATPLALTLSFTERLRTNIRSNNPALAPEDRSAAGGGTAIQLPEVLKEFAAYANNEFWANRLFQNEVVGKVFSRYKYRDGRGKPMLSLEIIDGVILLRFSPPGELEPSILNLWNDVARIENYMEDMILLAYHMHRIYRDQQ